MKHLAVKIKSESNDFDRVFSAIKKTVELQVKKDIRILTIGIPEEIPDESKIELFKFYLKKDFINLNRIKISFIGKWYDISGAFLDIVKKQIDETKEYDGYFLNFVVNYDGQEEIVDACKILCRQVNAGKIGLDRIDKGSIKDNLYSSYFMPPELIIVTGKRKGTDGFLLWDSVNSEIEFTGKDFEESDIEAFL
jgi:undecaprenyl diphosphate synthase